ncbi:hypothetical protein [Niveispirillum sp. KHB5.9]|uniref:hypothetical protein n=1 Tax=Niveispirillum sp. KHB5.9 TaxID=3400269 RepID=UPI003A8B6016
MNKEQVLIEFSVSNCAAELSLNDIPLFHFKEGATRSRAAGPADPYLLRGLNRLSIVLAPGPTPTTSHQPGAWLQPEARVLARVRRHRLDGQDMDDARPLAQLEWPRPGQPPVSRPGPVTDLSIDFTIDHPEPRSGWYWRRAKRPDNAQVGSVLRRLHADLSVGDTTSLMGLHQPKILDFCTAMGMDPAIHRQNLETSMRQIVTAPDFRLWPTSQLKMAPRLIAGGQMMDLLCDDWLPPIRSGVPDTASWFTVRLRLGVLDGEVWILC